MSRIAFGTWLQISGPTFAAMVFGFALLWNAQQATSTQVLDLGRTIGRLEGSIEGVERSIGTLNSRLDRLSDSVERLAGRLHGRAGPS